MIKPLYHIILVATILLNQNSFAGIEDDMSEFWDSLGGVSNANKAQFVKSQKAGHMSLGGIQIRSNIQNAQLASVRLPSVRAGCGGIDFFAGGFSFISSDQLIALGKSIISNSAGALAQLALDNISPQMGSVLKYFQNVAREINQLNINSCQAANALINDRGGLINSIKTHGCRTWGLASYKYKDASEARAECTSGGHATQTQSPEAKEVTNINIAWAALKEANILDIEDADSVELSELFMTLTGTIIISGAENDNADGSSRNIGSEIESDKMIQSLLEGRDIRKLKCSDVDKCLNPQYENYSFDSNKSFLGLVEKALTEIQEHIASSGESKLSDNTQKILTITSVPIYKFASLSSLLSNNNTELYTLSEYIAYDVLYKYLNLVIDKTKRATDNLNKGSSEKVYKDFFKQQDEIQKSINTAQEEAGKKYQDYILILNRGITVENLLQKMIAKNLKFMDQQK